MPLYYLYTSESTVISSDLTNTMSSWERKRPLTQEDLEIAIANLSESEDDLDILSDEEDDVPENFPLETDGSKENVDELPDETYELFNFDNIPIFFFLKMKQSR